MATKTNQRRYTPLAPTPRMEDLHSLENSIICGDCKDRMFEHIPDDSIDLIYMDPPFFSGTQYDLMWGEDSKATIQSFEDAAFYKKVCGKCNADWGKDSKGSDFELCDNYKCDGVLEDAKDVRRNDIETYLGWLKERIYECYRALKPTGSIYVHLDWHAVHYVKVMMDEIFEMKNFRDEIIWNYGARATVRKAGFPRKHDTILSYSKSSQYTYNPVYKPYKDVDMKRYNKHDESGQYALIKRKRTDGTVYYGKSYVNPNGAPETDVWDIPTMASTSKERIGYPTQKPESLLERIIKASSNPGDLVLDPFCGCGTTITVAQRLSRRWIGIDVEAISCTVQQARMERTYGKEFPIIDLGKGLTEAEAKQATIDARKMDPFAFQKWAVILLGGKPNSRVVGDDGIDGWIVDPFADLVRGDLIQAKRSDSVGKDVIKLHAYNIQKYGVTGGLVIGFGFTSGSHDEVKTIRETGINIELLTVKNMMMQTGKNVKSCGKQSTSKQAIL